MKSSFVTFTAALVTGVVALAGYGVWYRAVAAKSAAAADLENQIATTIQTAKRLSAARAALAQITNDETSVRNYFVPQTEVVAFINDLEARGHAQKATVNVASVSTGGTIAQPMLELALTVSGSFDAVMRTIGTIEYAPYALSIKQFSFRQDAENNWYADLKVSVGSVPPTSAPAAPRPPAP